jgi:hypothetical protein
VWQAAQGKLILIMTVEIGDGRADNIRVHEHSDPAQLAAAFVRQHGLAETVVAPLTEHIRANIAALPPRGRTPRPASAPATPRTARSLSAVRVLLPVS